jgi:hypothetical protein
MNKDKLIKDKLYRFKYRNSIWIAYYDKCIFNTYIFRTNWNTCYLSETKVNKLIQI